MEEFEAIFMKYMPMVFHYLLSLCGDESLAEEVTSETFYQAYLHIGKFRGDCKIETWLCQIAKNALRKEQRRRSRITGVDILEDIYSDYNMFEAIANREVALQIHRHLHTLQEPYREVFMLRVFGSLGFREIADICGKSESWAKVTYYRAKNKLMEAMEGKL